MIKAAQIAKKWNVNERRVRQLARQGRIKGAVFINRRWYINENAPKPTLKAYKDSLAARKYPIFKSSDGKYGECGGKFMPEAFAKFFDPILPAFEQMVSTGQFERKMKECLKDTQMFIPENFNRTLGDVKLIIKREDQNTSGTVYSNQAFPFAMLFKRLKKRKLLLACGSASFLEAYAEACTQLKVPYYAYISYDNYLKQKKAFEDVINKYHPEHLFICEGAASLFDAVNYGFRQYLYQDAQDFYVLYDALGPAPIPQIVEFCQSVVGRSAQIMLKRMGIEKLSAIVAPAGVGSNALGIFNSAKSYTNLILVESTDSNPVLSQGHFGGLCGFTTLTLASKGFCDFDLKPVCPEISFPAISPKLANGVLSKRIKIAGVTDKEAMLACKEFYELEGIFPCLADGYCLAYVKKRAIRMKKGTVLMCFTCKGEKDREFINKTLREQ